MRSTYPQDFDLAELSGRGLIHGMNEPQDLRFLLLADVVEKTRYSPASIRKMVAEGAFPQPFDLSPKRLAWWAHEVEAWMCERAAKPRAKQRMPDQTTAGRLGGSAPRRTRVTREARA